MEDSDCWTVAIYSQLTVILPQIRPDDILDLLLEDGLISRRECSDLWRRRGLGLVSDEDISRQLVLDILPRNGRPRETISRLCTVLRRGRQPHVAEIIEARLGEPNGVPNQACEPDGYAIAHSGFRNEVGNSCFILMLHEGVL